MKRTLIYLVLLMYMAVGSQMMMAQIIIVPPSPTPIPDTDGDGLNDNEDKCPRVPGSIGTNGCPPDAPRPTEPPQNPPSSQPQVNPPSTVPNSVPEPTRVPPFTPPTLPPNGCYVTPARDARINVRSAPDINAEILGSLLPGVIYEAQGYVMAGLDAWFQLTNYEGSIGTAGYASRSVLLYIVCPELPGDNASTRPNQPAGDFASLPPRPLELCYMSVGYDAPSWGSSFDPILSDESSVWGAFYFAAAPGAPILEGTPIWGVITLDGFNELPPDSPKYFDPSGASAVAGDQSLVNAAAAGGVNLAFSMSFPNMNGGVMAGNGTTFYRLSDPAHYCNCGPIIAINDLVSPPDAGLGGPQSLQCNTKPGTTIVSDCWCQTSDSACVEVLVSICTGGGAYVDSGPDMTACWFDPAAAPLERPVMDYVMQGMSTCENDLSVWWIELPNGIGAPEGFRDIKEGFCIPTLAALPRPQRSGTVRLLAGRGQSIVDPTDVYDCDGNLIPDFIQTPPPDCTINDLVSAGSDDAASKETPGWWRDVLDLMCPGDWIMMVETDADGEEVVTDAQCDD